MYELVGELEPDLGILETRDLIRRRSGSSIAGEVEYVFKHAVTSEVSYSGLTKARQLPEVDWFRRQSWFVLPAAAARLDALAVIGTEGSVRQEGLLQPTGYLEPFMLRALGMVSGDEGLVRDGGRKFRELRLDWHAAQTPVLQDLRRRN